MKTFDWYATHDFIDEESYETSSTSPMAPSHEIMLDNLRQAGLFDLIPSIEKITELVSTYNLDGPHNYNVNDYGSVLETVSWVLGRILKDPDVDPKIIEFVYSLHSKDVMTHCYLGNSTCPKWILMEVTSKRITSINNRKFEEMTFILFNKNLSADVVEVAAMSSKIASNQMLCVRHKNVTKSALAHLAKHSKFVSVKSAALLELQKRGLLLDLV